MRKDGSEVGSKVGDDRVAIRKRVSSIVTAIALRRSARWLQLSPGSAVIPRSSYR